MSAAVSKPKAARTERPRPPTRRETECGHLAYWQGQCLAKSRGIAARVEVPNLDAHTVQAFAFCAIEDATAPFLDALENAIDKAAAAVEKRFASLDGAKVRKAEGGAE